METIRCRIKRSYWWMVPVIAGAGVSALFGPTTMPPEQSPSSLLVGFMFFGGFSALCFFGAIYLVASLLHEEVIADEIGLRWRGAFGPWKSAKWEEISDFYLEKWKRTPTIETPQGKLKIIPELAGKEGLMALIAERSANAPARGWEMEKLRAHHKYVKRFDYWTNSQKWTAPLSFGTLIVCGILLFGLNYFSPKSAIPAQPIASSRPFDWLSLLMALVGFGPVAALFIFIAPLMWRERTFAYRHRAEHLEISPRGLAWQNGENRIEASWDEVRAITPIPARGFGARTDYRVETPYGDFTVWQWLEGIQLWLQLARQFAPQLAPAPPITNLDLGGEAATWSGPKIGEGARIFHFRTSDTRLVLWATTAFGVVLPLLPMLMTAMKTPDDDPAPLSWEIYAAALFLVILALTYLWFCFRRAAIWADETGLEWRFPLFKTRRVAWSEIESFGRDENGHFLVANARQRRLFWSVTPVRQNELLQLIAERASNASGKWDSI